ncbi:MAG: hypothetical protein JW803_09590 [Endomicrobiales bacterium]|nr:hypothetical protein [Endomicrobiales bacterium]
MNINPVQFANLEIPRKKVLLRLGFSAASTRPDEKTDELIAESIETAKKLIVPRQVVAFSAVKKEGGQGLRLEPGFKITSKDIAKLLDNCETAYGFAVTIGNKIEEKRDLHVQEKETTRALVMDAIGSVMAEELAEITHSQIRQETKPKGLFATRRFSPGYGDWPLSAQKDFLAWLGAESIGIKLTDNFQMLPEKSVSAILGLAREQK